MGIWAAGGAAVLIIFISPLTAADEQTNAFGFPEGWFEFHTKAERVNSSHPTIKPLALMRWLVRMVCPPGGLVLDPFAGSGTTGHACMGEGFNALLIERESESVADIKRRIAHVSGLDAPLFVES